MEKVLIVDDSIVQAAQLKNILEDEYDVDVVHSAEEGLRRAMEEDFSLILLDVVMPEMDGFTLLKKLKEESTTQSVPVILITTLSDVVNEQNGLILGAVDYIIKPFNPQVVKVRVNTHIRLYRYQRQIEQQSMTDQLTGVANRRKYEQYSIMRWNDAIRLQLPFSIGMFDIDDFKVYNDTFGHLAGDAVIATVAKTVDSHFQRGTDFLARYGGEEFVVLSLGESSEQIFESFTKIRQEVENLHIPHAPCVSEWVTISAGGITVIPEVGSSYDFYFKIADIMLYDAKKHGRNMVVWTDENLKQLWEKDRFVGDEKSE